MAHKPRVGEVLLASGPLGADDLAEAGKEDRFRAVPPLDYPLEYTFKIIGHSAEDFAEHARLVVSEVVGEAPAGRVSVRVSAGGRYHSVSVTATLVSEEQRRAVYQALWDDERVVYYL